MVGTKRKIQVYTVGWGLCLTESRSSVRRNEAVPGDTGGVHQIGETEGEWG